MQYEKYLELLNHLKTSSHRNRSKSLCCFSAQKGSEYNNNLMIVGRAVNGWGNHFDLDSLDVNSMVKAVFEQPSQSFCPMKWVEESWGIKDGYNTNRSAFWRVTKQISTRLNKSSSDDGWASKIVWSNLYKVAPSETGNPSNRLCDEQFNSCNELLMAEIEEYRPNTIIFFTGLDWFNGFLNHKLTLSTDLAYNLIEAHGTLKIEDKEISIIIAKHPQGKSEGEMVNEIFSIPTLANV
ncbi:uracil-DNA glycosylase family protein [Vibrio splendidus]